MTEAIDALFDRVEKILDQEDGQTKISRELRDSLIFYTAHHIRQLNGKITNHDKQLMYIKIALVIMVIVVFIEHPALRSWIIGLLG